MKFSTLYFIEYGLNKFGQLLDFLTSFMLMLVFIFDQLRQQQNQWIEKIEKLGKIDGVPCD